MIVLRTTGVGGPAIEGYALLGGDGTLPAPKSPPCCEEDMVYLRPSMEVVVARSPGTCRPHNPLYGQANGGAARVGKRGSLEALRRQDVSTNRDSG